MHRTHVLLFSPFDRGQDAQRVRRLAGLLPFDPDRQDWLTFRVDRVDRPSPTHRHFRPCELPAPDAASYLTEAFAAAPYRYTARVTVQLPAETVRVGLFARIPGSIESASADECTVRLSAETTERVIQYVAAIAALGADFTLDAPEEIASRMRELGRRLAG